MHWKLLEVFKRINSKIYLIQGAYDLHPVNENGFINSANGRYVALINTYSSTQLLEENVRTAYLDEIRRYIDDNGGIVKMPQLVMLYLVKK